MPRAASLGETRKRLPKEFIESIDSTFPQSLAEAILRGMGSRRLTTLRVNTLKSSAGRLMAFFRENAVKHRRVRWYADAFVLAELRERDAESWTVYAEGRIYLQSLSSMIPALVLGPLPGEHVLDIAAAPGSKTTQMSALMRGQGSILANDVDAVRAQRLEYNVRLQGCPNVTTRVGRGEKLGQVMPGSFDRVLLDAPCSGEGRFIVHEPGSSRAWSTKLVAESARLQRRLLASGCAALKPHGILVYSTCTLNLEENEKMIQWALASLPLRVEALPCLIPGAWQGLTRGMDPSLSMAVRLFPDEQREGFFICRLRKTARDPA